MRSRSSFRAVAFFLFSLLLSNCLSGCRTGKGTDVLQTSTPSEIAITIAEDSDQNVAAESSIRLTPTPDASPTTEAPDSPGGEERGYDYFASVMFNGAGYLLSDVRAVLCDADVSDGISDTEDGTVIRLSGGTVLMPVWESDDLIGVFSPGLRWVTMDGRCIRVNATINADGTVLFEGKEAKDLFSNAAASTSAFYGTSNFDVASDVTAVREVYPMQPADHSQSYREIVIRVDWNGDGKEDCFDRKYRIIQNGRFYDPQVIYTDGATGETTDITDKFSTTTNGEPDVFSDSIFLYRSEDGRYALIDTLDQYDGMNMIRTRIYHFGAKSLLVTEDVDGQYESIDGKSYIQTPAEVFGFGFAVRKEVEVQDDFSIRIQSDLQTYVNSSPGAIAFTYAFAEAYAEKKNGSQWEQTLVPAGIAIFPDRLEMSDADKGYIYYVTYDGTQYRAPVLLHVGGLSVNWIGGTDQTLLYQCSSEGG